MRKFTAPILAALCIVMLAPQADAQSIHYGLKTGLDFSSITFKTTETGLPDFKGLSERVQGLYVSFKLGPVAVQPELLFVRSGTSFIADEEPGVGRVTQVYKLNYIEIPVLVKYSFQAGPVRPCVFAGPSFAYLLKARVGSQIDYFDGAEGSDYESYQDFEDYFKKSDFGAVGGIGVEYKLSQVILSLEARYRLGLTDINNGFLSGDSTMKNKGLSVMAGIGF